MKRGNIIRIDRREFNQATPDADISKDEYKDIWDNGEDDLIDYSELDGYEFENDEDVDEETEARWAAIDRLKGTIQDGDCLYCGKQNGMHYVKGYYCCKTCHDLVPEEVYLQWYAGFDVYFD